MQFYVPWSFVAYLLGWVSCVAFFLLVARIGMRAKPTATQEKYTAALNARGDLDRALSDLQEQLDSLRGDGDA